LAAVLEGIEAEVGKFCNLFAGCPDSKNTALVLRTFFTRQDVVVE
jgi:hypothetical protein